MICHHTQKASEDPHHLGNLTFIHVKMIETQQKTSVEQLMSSDTINLLNGHYFTSRSQKSLVALSMCADACRQCLSCHRQVLIVAWFYLHCNHMASEITCLLLSAAREFTARYSIFWAHCLRSIVSSFNAINEGKRLVLGFIVWSSATVVTLACMWVGVLLRSSSLIYGPNSIVQSDSWIHVQSSSIKGCLLLRLQLIKGDWCMDNLRDIISRFTKHF